MFLMKKLGYRSYNLKDINYINNSKSFIVTFDDGYEDVFLNAAPILKKFNFKATCFIVSNFIGKYNIWDHNKLQYKQKKLMDDNQINEWINSGFEIGSHTYEHKNLKTLKYQEKEKEILEPKKLFLNKFNTKIVSFSYPYGSLDNESIEIIKKNYKYAVTTRRSRYKKNKFNYFELPRVPINVNDGIFKFFLKIKTIYEDIKF
jgi:peptidoglycan/xylan/chitin deacetylase (PgdA/CDA1 family)